METKHQRRKKTIGHINRIIGQLERLKKDIADDKACHDIAALTSSISNSCDSLKMRTLEGFVIHELGQNASEQSLKHIEKIIKLYK